MSVKDILTRAAVAICECRDEPAHDFPMHLSTVREVVYSIRVPNENMIAAARASQSGVDNVDFALAWREMIFAALVFDAEEALDHAHSLRENEEAKANGIVAHIDTFLKGCARGDVQAAWDILGNPPPGLTFGEYPAHESVCKEIEGGARLREGRFKP